ncbi:hypothetical protein ABTD27_19390, partial [Acinetobacter baumannii]
VECDAETHVDDMYCQECGVTLDTTDDEAGDKRSIIESVKATVASFNPIPKLLAKYPIPKLPTAMPALLGLGFFAVSIPLAVHSIDQSYDTMA